MAERGAEKRMGSGRLSAALGACLTVAALVACDSTAGPETAGCPPTTFDPAVTARVGSPPPGRLSLDPGEACVLRNARVATLAASPEAREYLVAVQSASTVPGAVAELVFAVRGPDAPLESAVAPSAVIRARPASIAPEEEASSRLELELRAAALRELGGVGARPARTAVTPALGPRAAILTGGGPAPGDTVRFKNSVSASFDVDCESDEEITAVVRDIGTGFAIAEDVATAGHLTAADFHTMSRELESVVFPVVTAYFGGPADLDGNGVVWVLLTAVVNRLTPPGSKTLIAGFHNPTDLADPETCAASNRSEILYALGADPDGTFADDISAAFVSRNTLSVAAHELQHLISAEQRVVSGTGGFPALEESWLSEGLAHTAETVAGLTRSGLPLGQGLGYDALTSDREGFDAYHFTNFRRVAWYAKNPEGTAALGDTARADPGGVPSLEMRGFAWLFLRWLADQFVAGGGGAPLSSREKALFEDLSRGGPTHSLGIANVERAIAALGARVRWRDLLAQYLAVPVAAGAAGVAPADRFRLRSFDLRNVFTALHEKEAGKEPFEAPYPLRVTDVVLDPSTEQAFALELGASTASYFMLRSDGPHPPMAVRLTGSAGGPVPEAARAQVTVLRAR